MPVPLPRLQPAHAQQADDGRRPRSAIIGGRNIQDEYSTGTRSTTTATATCWWPARSRSAMEANFDAFWNDHARAAPPSSWATSARVLLGERRAGAAAAATRRAAHAWSSAWRGPPATAPRCARAWRRRRCQVGRGASSSATCRRSTAAAHAKSRAEPRRRCCDAGRSSAAAKLLLQTPYLVLSRPARKLFRELQQAQPAAAGDRVDQFAGGDRCLPRLRDVAQVQAPVPARARLPDPRVQAVPGRHADRPRAGGRRGAADAALAIRGGPSLRPPRRTAARATSAPVRRAPLAASTCDALRRPPARPVPLKRAGVRIGLHSKSMVVDERIGIVGSHNFDPRSDDYNTESLVMVARPGVRAGAGGQHPPRHRAGQFLGDRAARQAARAVAGSTTTWASCPRSCRSSTSGRSPTPPATSSSPAAAAAAARRTRASTTATSAVGDFPEVNLGLKMIYTRVLTVFGAGFIPIL